MLLSQSSKLSESYYRHEAKGLSLEIGKKVILEEIDTISKYRDTILEKIKVENDGEKTLKLSRELREISKQYRKTLVVSKAIDYVPFYQSLIKHNEIPRFIAENPAPVENRPWMDIFSDFAEKNNERWRQELLSQALAKEAVAPKSVSLKAIWNIGVLEEDVFESLSIFMDTCATLDIYPLIVPTEDGLNEEFIPIPNTNKGIAFSTLFTNLSEHQLATHMDIEIASTKPGKFEYDNQEYELSTKADWLKLNGYCLTDIGLEIFWLYRKGKNNIGQKYFEQLLIAFNDNPDIKVTRMDSY